MKTIIWLLENNKDNTVKKLAEFDGFISFPLNSLFMDIEGNTWKLTNGGKFESSTNTMHYSTYEKLR